MVNIDLIGYLAGFIVAASLMPQVMKSWKTKSTKDISLTWALIYFSGLILWIIYGIGIASLPIIIAVTIESSLALSLIMLKMRYG